MDSNLRFPDALASPRAPARGHAASFSVSGGSSNASDLIVPPRLGAIGSNSDQTSKLLNIGGGTECLNPPPSSRESASRTDQAAAGRERAVPNLPNVSEHERCCAAAFMTSKAEWSAAAARQPCTRANRMALRVGLINKPAAHRQVINILQRLARQSDGSIVDMNPKGSTE